MSGALPRSGGRAPATLPEVCLIDVRGPDRQLIHRLPAERANLLVAGALGAEVRSPAGVLRYIQLHRNPVARGFSATLGEDSITTFGPPLRRERREHDPRRCAAYRGRR